MIVLPLAAAADERRKERFELGRKLRRVDERRGQGAGKE